MLKNMVILKLRYSGGKLWWRHDFNMITKIALIKNSNYFLINLILFKM